MIFQKSGILGSWEHSNLGRIDVSSKLPHKLREIIRYWSETEPQPFEKIIFNTCVQNLTSLVVLKETIKGKITIMAVGSLQVFIKNVTLTSVLQVKVHVSPKTLIFICSV